MKVPFKKEGKKKEYESERRETASLGAMIYE